MMNKRVDDNDAEAICQLGHMYFYGEEGFINKDIDKAIKLLLRAAELESAKAYKYNTLGAAYCNGEGVSKDETKGKQYFEKAAMAGCVTSRFNLGVLEFNAGRFDRATKHWLIGAISGDLNAVNGIKKVMGMGKATRDHYAQALQGYQQYVNAVRSEQQNRAAAYSEKYKYLET
jgi:TPR repeat protein